MKKYWVNWLGVAIFAMCAIVGLVDNNISAVALWCLACGFAIGFSVYEPMVDRLIGMGQEAVSMLEEYQSKYQGRPRK